jgi:putative phosphoribosyl transferase
MDKFIDCMIRVSLNGTWMEGRLTVPPRASGLVVFARGNGSSKYGQSNLYLANALQDEGLATLRLDMLTPEEQRGSPASLDATCADTEVFGKRLLAATDWAREQLETKDLAVGYFATGTGAGAALHAAAARPSEVGAVVSCGGQCALEAADLLHVRAPTLLLVGAEDVDLVKSNQEVVDRLDCLKALEIVPGANALFDSRPALEQVAHAAASWFAWHLSSLRALKSTG